MSLKKRILSFFTAFLMIFGSTPFAFENASAEEGTGLSAPQTNKTLIPNDDGTYTLALSVTGETASSSSTSCSGANVVLVLDTSNSMNSSYTTYNGTRMRRIEAEKKVLTDDNGIIDKMLAKNTTACPNMIEVAIATFGKNGEQKLNFTNSATTLKSTINGLTSSTGTNWEEGLQQAKSYADSIKATQQNEDVYVIFMTDGEPTTHNNSYNVNTNYATEWGYANDDARSLVTSGYKLYGIFTWGSSSSSKYLSSLIQYAYTGSGNSNSSLSSSYAQYFTDATDTQSIIDALNTIINQINTSVEYTNVGLTDGLTGMTESSISTSVEDGTVSGFKYYRSGGSYGTADFNNHNFGTEWTDAPEATVSENGDVKWNLGDRALEHGVTYTITFTIWPSQEALDLVADLENGEIIYSELSDEQKSSIVEKDGSYKLKTNKDFPSVTYSTVTTTTVNGVATTVTSDPTTVDIKNPEPVELLETKLTIRKIWADGLDPSQRKDYGGKVVLDLYRAGEIYEEGITLSEDNDWKLEDYIAIAPGLMISSVHEAYTYAEEYTADGVYGILDLGHDYYFTEPDITKHFDLTDATYHPMLVDGTLKNVTYHKDEEGKVVIDSMENLEEITATNTIKGGIEVKKEVYKNDELDSENKEEFELTITLKNANGKAYTNADGSEAQYRIYEADGSRSDKKSATNGVIAEKIDQTQYIIVQDLESGSFYKAEENTENLPFGYSDEEIEYGIARDGGDAEEFSDNEKTSFENETYYIVEGNASSKAIVRNYYYTGDLKISKTVEVKNGNEDLAKSKEFNFTATIKNGEEVLKTETCELKDGKNCIISDIPAGATYEIVETEADKDGFTTTSENKSGTIKAKDVQESSFTNTYNATGTAEFTVIKQFGLTENPFWMIQDDFKFVLKNESGRQIGEAKTIDKLTHSATFEIEIKKEGDYKYVVEELEDNFKTGVTRKENDTNVIVTFTATDNGKGEFVVSNLTYESSKDTIYNSYTVEEELEDALKFKKVFSEEGADYEGDAEFNFTVSMSEGAPKPSNLNEDGTFTLKNNEEIDLGSINFSETDIPAEGKTYTYTITESNENLPNGVSIVSGEVEITVNVKFDKETGKLDVTTNQYETEFVNIYVPEATKIDFEIHKEVDNLTSDAETETFTFELKNEKGEVIATVEIEGE